MMDVLFAQYCDAVCAHVHYPFVRPALRAELTAHLGDPAEAWLIDSPSYIIHGFEYSDYRELLFVLEIRHRQPWLGSVNIDWTKTSITDGAGRTGTLFDGTLRLQAGSERVSPFTDRLWIHVTPLDDAETHYTLTIPGPDGRALTFTVNLTDWEATP